MSLTKILVATDFSAPAQRAVHRAAHLAKQTGAELQLVHVLPEPGMFERLFRRAALTHGQMLKGAQSALRSACNALETHPGVSATWTALIGSPRSVIEEAAQTFGADLLVIGARGENESPLEEPSLGGTALKLLGQGDVPLGLVRRPGAEPYRNVLIAVDDAASARRVLAGAQPVVGAADCVLLHAFEAPFAARLRALEFSAEAIDAYALEQHTAQEQALQKLIAESSFIGTLRPLIVRGEPVAAVLEQIEKLDADLLVVGKHGRHPRNGLGSVALRTAFSAPCDVLQIPPE